MDGHGIKGFNKMSHTVLAVFVKTPNLSPVKTRLAKDIGKEKALEFYHLSLKAITHTLQNADITPHWAVGEKEGLNDPLWKDFKTLHTGEGDLGARQQHIYNRLLEKHDRVILIGADAPQLSTSLIENATTQLQQHNFVIGPANDGGYYLLGGKKEIPDEIWQKTPWSADNTREILESHLRTKAFHLSTLTDVDDKKSLIKMVKEMPANLSPEQQALINFTNSLL